MLAAILTMAMLALAFGLILGYSAQRFRVEGDPIADQIDALLPQTQCGQCSFPGCRPYAEAIASGSADINRCPPGGEATVLALADLLGRDPQPLENEARERSVAVIDEETCIGCTLCIQACPVDAILGAAKHMHTVIESECTGCELCLEPCPVDCITMVPLPQTIRDWRWALPAPSPIERRHWLDTKSRVVTTSVER
jgi:electron transport complex protein RnfB